MWFRSGATTGHRTRAGLEVLRRWEPRGEISPPGCARRRPGRSPEHGGSNPPTSTVLTPDLQICRFRPHSAHTGVAMGWVEKRRNGWVAREWMNGKKTSEYFRTRTEAEVWARTGKRRFPTASEVMAYMEL